MLGRGATQDVARRRPPNSTVAQRTRACTPHTYATVESCVGGKKQQKRRKKDSNTKKYSNNPASRRMGLSSRITESRIACRHCVPFLSLSFRSLRETPTARLDPNHLSKTLLEALRGRATLRAASEVGLDRVGRKPGKRRSSRAYPTDGGDVPLLTRRSRLPKSLSGPRYRSVRTRLCRGFGSLKCPRTLSIVHSSPPRLVCNFQNERAFATWPVGRSSLAGEGGTIAERPRPAPARRRKKLSIAA